MKWPFSKTPPALYTSPAVAESLDATVARYNRWRDQLNPLRGLTISSAISMLDRVQAGQTADFAWTCKLIERRDEDLIAVIESTTSALTQLEWRIRTAEGDTRRARDWDETLAAEQSSALLDHYNRSLNIYDVLEHLALSKFRGYSHAQIMADGQWLRTAEIINHWNVCRDGSDGPWYWNPEAKDLPASSLPPSNRMDESAYLILETNRPIDEVALLKYLRCSMSAKDWDAFIEIYGIPSWIVTMPPNVPKGREAEYRDAAIAVAKGGSGALPNGADAKAAGYPAGSAPFRDHLQWWSERLVLAATGGLLTSVALPTGIGSGASDAHSETFARIARGRARLISEEFQRKIDRRILDAAFPGRPHLAYFEFSANEATDTGAVIEEITKLASAGYRISSAEVSEKTGYAVTDTGSMPTAPAAAPILSRASGSVPDAAPASASIEEAAVEALAEARARNLAPVIDRLLDALAETDPAVLHTALSGILDDLPALVKAAAVGIDADASLVERILSDAVGAGFAESQARIPKAKAFIKSSFDLSQPRDGDGKWSRSVGGTQYHRYSKSATGSQDVPWQMMALNEDEVSSGYGDNHFISDSKGAILATDLGTEIAEAIDRHPEITKGLQADGHKIAKSANPTRIVDSAGLWDNADVVQIIWDEVLEPNGITKVITDDGMIVFDPDEIVRSDISKTKGGPKGPPKRIKQ